MAVALFLQALTPLHPGVGREEGAHVDLPVQRDEFGLPTIWASSLKGAIKSAVRPKDERKAKALLGRDPGEQGEASPVALLDARLLLIPARSLRGVWIYLTSPHLLRQLATYLDIARQHEELKKAVESLAGPEAKDAALVSSDRYLHGGHIYLNEQKFTAKQDAQLKKFMELLQKKVPDLPKADLALVSDDAAPQLVRRSMLVQYRVRLSERKTVQVGPWSEEYIPQFTVMHTAAVCTREARLDEKTVLQPDQACEEFRKLLLERPGDRPAEGQKGGGQTPAEGQRNHVDLWLGGKETVGRGLVRLYL